MGRKVKSVLNGDLTDPLTLNILIYTGTYVLSIIFSISIYRSSPSSESTSLFKLFQILTDCIVPTTTTLALGNVIQNVVSASQAGVSRFALSIWVLIIAFAYMLLYPFFRDIGCVVCIIVWLISVGIVVLGMHAIIQVDKERRANTTNTKSLSG